MIELKLYTCHVTCKIINIDHENSIQLFTIIPKHKHQIIIISTVQLNHNLLCTLPYHQVSSILVRLH